MSFTIDLTFDAIELRLSGWDAIRLVRQRLAMPYQFVTEVAVVERAVLEAATDPDTAPGAAGDTYGKRVGATDASGGTHFWAVGASSGGTAVVVVDTTHDRFSRLILEPAQVDAFVETLRSRLARG